MGIRTTNYSTLNHTHGNALTPETLYSHSNPTTIAESDLTSSRLSREGFKPEPALIPIDKI
jgi:hypothetical protein